MAEGRSVFLIWFKWIISEVFLSACSNFSYRRSVFSAAAWGPFWAGLFMLTCYYILGTYFSKKNTIFFFQHLTQCFVVFFQLNVWCKWFINHCILILFKCYTGGPHTVHFDISEASETPLSVIVKTFEYLTPEAFSTKKRSAVSVHLSCLKCVKIQEKFW